MKADKQKIDAYIQAAKPFAQPILRHLRALVHQACPEVEETIKWHFPHFEYKGIICSMAAFQKHCAFTFKKGSLMKDPHKVMDKTRAEAMGQFGRLTKMEDLPSDKILLAYIREAVQLNDDGIKLPKKTKKPKVVDFLFPLLEHAPEI